MGNHVVFQADRYITMQIGGLSTASSATSIATILDHQSTSGYSTTRGVLFGPLKYVNNQYGVLCHTTATSPRCLFYVQQSTSIWFVFSFRCDSCQTCGLYVPIGYNLLTNGMVFSYHVHVPPAIHFEIFKHRMTGVWVSHLMGITYGSRLQPPHQADDISDHLIAHMSTRCNLPPYGEHVCHAKTCWAPSKSGFLFNLPVSYG